MKHLGSQAFLTCVYVLNNKTKKKERKNNIKSYNKQMLHILANHRETPKCLGEYFLHFTSNA